MSLQVWLPLNGNLNNQGLSDITITNSGATVDSSGKIGKCYFCSSASYLYTNNFYLNTESFSVAYWVKYATIGSWNTYIVSLNNSTNEDYQFMIGSQGGADNTSSSTNLRINAALSGRISIPKNEWHHCCATWQNNTVTIYVDGKKDSIFNGVAVNSGATHLNINCRSTSTSGAGYGVTGLSDVYVNDIRIYDHCLSAKEVKEISKGLICHYKLDNNGFGNPNLFFNSHFDSRYTVSDWDTSKNGSLCANDWGGYNEGVGNPSTVYHAHLQEHEGEYVYNYHKTSNENWLGIAQSVVTSVEVGKTYTFSCELKRISGKNFANGGLYTKANSSTTDYTFVNWFEFSEFASVTDNKWHKYSYTFTIDSSVYMMNGASWYIYGHSWEDGEFLMRRPKLEEGSVATPWIPHTSDSLYTSLGLDSTTESDCSGYKNDGNKIGNVLSLSESGRYSTSTYCNSTNIGTSTPTGAAFIKCALVSPIINATTLTINWWGNIEDYSYQDSGILSLSNDPSYPSDYMTSALAQYDSIFRFNLTDGNDSSIDSLALIDTGNWHMYTLVFNNGTVQGYRDGVFIISSSKSGTLAQFSYIYMGINVAGGAHRQTKSKWSDFRIYSTALSASDIKELYNTSASIDKNGNMYAYEFKEE